MWSWGRGAAAGGGSGCLLVGPEAARQAACGSLTSPSAPGMIRSPVGGGTMFPTGKTLARSEVLLQGQQVILVLFLLGEKLKPRAGRGRVSSALCGLHSRKGRVLLTQLQTLL